MSEPKVEKPKRVKFSFDGVDYEGPRPEDLPIEYVEGLFSEPMQNQPKMIRAVLGDQAYAQFKAGKPTVGSLGGFLAAYEHAVGAEPGESDASGD